MWSDLILYVSPSGSDSNSGLSAADPLGTIQRAVDIAYQQDFSGHDVIIQLADGVYQGQNVSVKGHHKGMGNLRLRGNLTTPSNVHIKGGTDGTIIGAIWAHEGGIIRLDGGIKLSSDDPGAFTCLRSTFNGRIFIDGAIEFGGANLAHMNTGGAGGITINSAYTVSGSAPHHMYLSTSGNIATIGGDIINFVGSPDFSVATVFARGNSSLHYRCNHTGAVTGKKFIIESGGVINADGNGVSHLPGDVAGVITCGSFDNIGPSGASPTAFRGALVKLSADYTLTNSTSTFIPWALTVYDTDSIFSSGNPTRLTVPSGVSKVRVSGSVCFEANASGRRIADIYKNGSSFPGISNYNLNATTTGATNFTLPCAVIDVTPGDYFELRVNQDSGGALGLHGNDITWFSMEVVV